MRMIRIEKATSLDELSGALLRARLGADRADAALASLRALNPHEDIEKLRAGSVLLVPDEPSFKVSGTDPVAGETFEDFRKHVQDALSDVAGRLKTANATRAQERAEVAAAVKSAAIKRLAESDAQLKQQISDAADAAKDDQRNDEQAAESLEAASKAALAKLAELGKLLG